MKKQNLLFLALLLFLKFGEFYSQQQCVNSYLDYIPDNIDTKTTPIIKVKLKYHIIQKDALNPENFENNLTTTNLLMSQVDYMNNKMRNLSLPNIPILPNNLEITDSRIQFSLNEEDIVYHINPTGWDRDPLLISSPYNILNVSPINSNDEQIINIFGITTLSQNFLDNEIYIDNGINNSYETYEYVSRSYSSTTGITSITIKNPNQSNITVSNFLKTAFRQNKNCTADNSILYASNDPGYLHIFLTGSSKPQPQFNIYGCSFGPTSCNVTNSFYSGFLGSPNLVLHEILHCLGLDHTDFAQFDDLPLNDNMTIGTCDANQGSSNNIMNNTDCREYLSPKQIGFIRFRNFFDLNSEPNVSIQEKLSRIVDCNGSLLDESLIINKNTLWNYSMYVSQNIIVKSGSTLEITCDIYLHKDLKIVVEKGATLKLNGGKLTTPDCIKMWEGIYVEGDRYLSQLQLANQGRVVMMNEAVIENALNGIRTIGLQRDSNEELTNILNWDKTGGVIQCTNSTFKNCWRGVEFLSYHNTYNSINFESNNISFFDNVQFLTTKQLNNNINNLNPYYFVTLYDVKGIRFNGCNFENTQIIQGTINLERRGNGIGSLDASYFVNAKYNVLTGNVIPNTYNTFKNLYTGVSCSGSSGLSNIIIKNNDFYRNVNNINLIGSNYGTIEDNNFNIFLASNTQFSYGIFVNGGNGFNIEHNNFEGFSGVNYKNQAVHINNSSLITSGKVYRNEVYNVQYGTQTVGNNGALRVDCNEFNKGNFSRIDMHHYNGNLSSQGIPSFPANNMFTGACSNTITNSQIYIDNNASQFNYTYKNTSGFDPNCSNVNIFTSITSDNTCPPSTLKPFVGKPIAISNTVNAINLIKPQIIQFENLIKIGDNDSLITIINTQSSGNAKNALINVSPYLSDRVLIHYINSSTPPGHIKDVTIANSPLSSEVMDVVIAKNLPNGIKNQILNAQNGISQRNILLSTIKYLNTERLNNIDYVVREYLDMDSVNKAIEFLIDEGSIEAICAIVPLSIKQDSAQAKLHFITIKNKADELILENPESERAKELKEFSTFQEFLTPIIYRKEGYYNLNREEVIKLQAYSQSSFSFNHYASAILDFISFKIPELVGYDATEPKMHLNDEENIKTNTYFNAFPNPSSSLITFELENNFDFNEAPILILTDILGKEIENLVLTQNSYIFDSSSFQQGIYFAHLVIDGQIIETIKLIHVK